MKYSRQIERDEERDRNITKRMKQYKKNILYL